VLHAGLTFTKPFHRIFIDTKSISEPTWDDHRVALIIVNDCTNACFVYTCHTHTRRPDPTSEKFICQSVSGLGYGVEKVGDSVNLIRSDRAGKFTGREYNEILTRVRAHGKYTEPCTPQQNGRVERKIRELLRCTRTLRIAENLPAKAWGELFKTSVP
jgi:hypothetical protein